MTLEDCEYAVNYLFNAKPAIVRGTLDVERLEKTIHSVTLPYQETLALSEFFDLVVQQKPSCKPVVDYRKLFIIYTSM